ncbi:GAF domain-containing protein [Deinococcus altitudinis]|uniref:GAF domain-containing sensor histidine kinase n=1 Tax=Deinococcus altitudinis TaxID=468914 RepID=UPI003892AFB8
MPLPSGADPEPFAPLAEYIQEITEALAATTTQREVIEIVLTPAVQAIGASAGIVLSVDETDQQMKIAGSQGYEDGPPTLWQEGPINDNVLIADILRMKEALYFEDAGALKEAYPELESRTGGLLPVANATLPMFLDGQPLGVIVLDFTEPHHFTPAERRFLKILSAQCAIALGRAQATVLLEDHVEARTRQLAERTHQLEDEQAAQAAFVAFTETVGSETDLFSLVREAVKALQSRFPGASIVYYEEEDTVWKGRVWSDDLNPELVAVISAGLPGDTPLFAQMLQAREPVFTDVWDAERERVASSEEYGAAANYPLEIGGELHWLLSIGLRDTRIWSEADRGLVRAVGRGLNLALERTETARQLALQNAELQARTQALEAFADLTRDLVLTTDPLLLIGRALEVVMSMLPTGAAMYLVPEGERWYSRVQHGSVNSPEMQAAVDAGLPYAQAQNLLASWTTGEPQFQNVYQQDGTELASIVAHIQATATLPLRIEGKLTGVLAFVLFAQRAWSSVDRAVLETVVRSLELALDRARQADTLKAKNAELEARTQALEGFALLTRDFSLEHDPVNLVGRAQELILSLLPEGTSTYYELQEDVWQLRSHRGDFHDLALLEVLKGGVSRGTILNLERPLETRRPYYQGNFDIETTTVAREAFQIIGATAALPIFVSDQVQGVLVFGLYEAQVWSAPDRAVLETVARSLGLALERSLAAQELVEQRDALDVQAASLLTANEELQAFSYSVSHDLRTPVRHMLGFLQLARTSLDGKLDERTARYLDVVGQAGEQMNALIDAMLDLSRAAQQTLRPQVVDLNKMVRQIQATLLSDLLTRNVQWEVTDLPEVWGDRDALTQVLIQLMENALKFTRTRDPAIIRVWAEDQGEAWKVCVGDNGLGFDPRYQDRLFNLFQRLHSQQEASGTGVGLASVRRLILKHGGRVFAEGQIGEGATFGFTLPKTSMPRP